MTMNNVVLMGRLTRDPEVRYSQGENPIAFARYTLAVDRHFKRGAARSRFYQLCYHWQRSRVCRKILPPGNASLCSGIHSDRKLYQ